MLSIKFIRENIDKITSTLKHKKISFDLDLLISDDVSRRNIINEVEKLKSDRNKVTKSISEKKKKGEDASHLIEEMRIVSEKIKILIMS